MKGSLVVPEPLLTVGGTPQSEKGATAPWYQVPQTGGRPLEREAPSLRNAIPFRRTWALTIAPVKGLEVTGQDTLNPRPLSRGKL